MNLCQSLAPVVSKAIYVDQTTLGKSLGQAPTKATDGRRQRSLDSRARIIQAMVDLVRGGVVLPNAEQVAERAKVGLRSVFRHFKDMDSLFRELTNRIENEARDSLLSLPTGDTVEERLTELINRRCSMFDRISPFYISGQAYMAKSEFLTKDSQRQFKFLREILKQALTPELVARTERFEALDALLSVHTWIRLRRDQGLDFDQAKAVIEQTAQLLIK